MKILVTFKPVPRFDAWGPGLPGPDAEREINPFDLIAIEESIRIRDRGEADHVVAVTVGPEAANEQVRSALAMGVDRAVRVDDQRPLDPYALARVLKRMVERESPGLVLLGKQAVDDDSGQVGQMLAGLLGWPQATFVSRIAFDRDRHVVECVRETDSGLETLSLTLPAVVTCDLRLNEPRYVSLPGLMKARRFPIECVTCDELGAFVRPLTTLVGLQPAPMRPPGVRLNSVEELVSKLVHDVKGLQ